MENQNLTRQMGRFSGKAPPPSDARRLFWILDKGLPILSTIELHDAVHEKHDQKRGWSWLQITAVVFAVVALVGALIPAGSQVSVKAPQSMAIGNCKQIANALKIYAGDHGGKYPDSAEPSPTTSNQAFRIFFREAILQDERLFNCPMSKFQTDGKIGTAPDFSKAVEPGENHWAMTKGVTDQSPASMPLVFENPKVPSWPPVWDTKLQGKPGKGRVWKGGKIIVGFNDTSVQAVKIEPPTSGESKKDVFTDAAASMKILDIEE